MSEEEKTSPRGENENEITDEQALILALEVIERQHRILVEHGIDPYTGKKLTP